MITFYDNKETASRREFLKRSSLGLGAGMAGVSLPLSIKDRIRSGKKLPREVTVVGVDLVGLWPEKTSESRIKKMLSRMDEITGLRPDIVCLPELFSTLWVNEKKNLADIAEDEELPGPVTSRVAEFARKNSCYVVCPTVTRKKDGGFYNSSLFIDRAGSIAGIYHKMHPVKEEILPNQFYKGGAVRPGAVNQPIIETAFGKVGLQTCYDANWTDGWDNTRKQGAEIVLFPSGFPGGRMLNYYALRNNSYIVSSTGGDARIVDISGNDLSTSNEFVHYAWADINLEKVNVPIWPTRDRLPEIFSKYGNRVGIKVWRSTDVMTIESLDPGLKVAAILKEFDVSSCAELLKRETVVQEKYRPA